MGAASFSDFEEEIKKIGLRNPIVKFENRSLKIITTPDFNDIMDLIILLTFSFTFIIDNSLLILSLICFSLFWYRLYTNFIGFDIFQIDFNTNTINTRNRIFLINFIRKVFGIRAENKFSDIKEIGYKENPLLDKLGFIRIRKRYFLLLETIKDPPIAISQFKDEKEIEKIIFILKKFILNKEKIIV
jgi:hypothetical protein